jgi:predicted secreted acid phosphatase
MKTVPPGKKFNELVIFDLDSTLANTSQRRHLSPYQDPSSDWVKYAKACANDTPIAGAVALANLLWNHYGIFILSGREDAAMAETKWWLARHQVMHDFLKLREAGDTEDNGLYKAECIEQLKNDGYTIHLLIDDWPDTVNTVMLYGTPALCVNPMYNNKSVAQHEFGIVEKAV